MAESVLGEKLYNGPLHLEKSHLGQLFWMRKGQKNVNCKLGVVIYIFNPSTWEVEEGGRESEASLGYIVRPCLKK
jgi:hypothetical protein